MASPTRWLPRPPNVRPGPKVVKGTAVGNLEQRAVVGVIAAAIAAAAETAAAEVVEAIVAAEVAAATVVAAVGVEAVAAEAEEAAAAIAAVATAVKQLVADTRRGPSFTSARHPQVPSTQ